MKNKMLKEFLNLYESISPYSDKTKKIQEIMVDTAYGTLAQPQNKIKPDGEWGPKTNKYWNQWITSAIVSGAIEKYGSGKIKNLTSSFVSENKDDATIIAKKAGYSPNLDGVLDLVLEIKKLIETFENEEQDFEDKENKEISDKTGNKKSEVAKDLDTIIAQQKRGNRNLYGYQKAFFEKYVPLVIKAAKEANSKIFPSVTLAQAALETGWGRKTPSGNSNNLFGIKAFKKSIESAKRGNNPYWAGDFVMSSTKEEFVEGEKTTQTSPFRKYSSELNSVLDHNRLLDNSSIYLSVRNATTPEEQAKNLQSAGYATGSRYAETLIRIINDYDLKKYDEFISNYSRMISENKKVLKYFTKLLKEQNEVEYDFGFLKDSALKIVKNIKRKIKKIGNDNDEFYDTKAAEQEKGEDHAVKIFDFLVDIIDNKKVYSTKQNNKDTGVFYLQIALASFKKSFKNHLKEADADFGKRTEKTVKKFQTFTKASVDGKFGPQSAFTMLMAYYFADSEESISGEDMSRVDVDLVKKALSGKNVSSVEKQKSSGGQTPSKYSDTISFKGYTGDRISRDDPRYYENVNKGKGDAYTTPYVQAVQDFGAALEKANLCKVTSYGRGPAHSMRATFQGPYAIDCILHDRYGDETGFQPGDYYFTYGVDGNRRRSVSALKAAMAKFKPGIKMKDGVYGRGGKYQKCFNKWEAKGARKILQKIGLNDSALQSAKGKNFGKEFWNDKDLAKLFMNVKKGSTGHLSGYGIDISKPVPDEKLKEIAAEFGLTAKMSVEATHLHVNIYRKEGRPLMSENKYLTKALKKMLFETKFIK
jgi:flagellum-specific peptidoglycan hydrolase FlgJ